MLKRCECQANSGKHGCNPKIIPATKEKSKTVPLINQQAASLC